MQQLKVFIENSFTFFWLNPQSVGFSSLSLVFHGFKMALEIEAYYSHMMKFKAEGKKKFGIRKVLPVTVSLNENAILVLEFTHHIKLYNV